MANPQEHRPPQQQEHQPGSQEEMRPQPIIDNPDYHGSGKLLDRVAIITGGDSGIGQAVAVAFAKEGADIAVVYLEEHEDAGKTKEMVEHYDRRCILIAGDVGCESFCRKAVQKTVDELGHLDILVNNAAEQHERQNLSDITAEELLRVFSTNIFSMFYLTKHAMQYLKPGAAIVNTTSVVAYEGHKTLLDYTATKGAIVGLTRALSLHLAPKGIRVNAVAPGPIWTPLIPASFSAEKVKTFGADRPLGRAGEPAEVAPSFVFLASSDASYMTGQVLHPNGGTAVSG